MGAWGVAIFSDDTAADIRDEFVDLIGDGLSASEATDRLIRDHRTTIADSDEGPVFWLALALTQHRLGRLEEPIRRRALEVIESGADLVRWEETGQVKKRQAVLAKAAATLQSPQPPPKKVAKRYRNGCSWKIGQTFAYQLLSGRFCAFRVIGFNIDMGGKGPVVEFLDWSGDQLPTKRDIKRARVRTYGFRNASFQALIGRRSERELPASRVIDLGIKTRVSQRPSGYTVLLWRMLDGFLETAWGLS